MRLLLNVRQDDDTNAAELSNLPLWVCLLLPNKRGPLRVARLKLKNCIDRC